MADRGPSSQKTLKVTEGREEKRREEEKTLLKNVTMFCLRCPRAVHLLRSEQNTCFTACGIQLTIRCISTR
jgi:hypothetical protein